MNYQYSYSVFYFNDDIDIFITEDSEVVRKEWSLDRLKKSIDTISKLDRLSYTRTKDWVKENKPELLI
jgi:hypothetical protein